MNLLFVGTGYVGLVSGGIFSYLGFNVTMLDSDSKKISDLNNGKLPIYEPYLDEYIEKAREAGNISFVDRYEDIKSKPHAIFICVGTPQKENGEANLEYVKEASLQAAKSYNFEEISIVIKSTVPPGTCEMVENLIRSEGCKNSVVSNPEFLREGRAVDDFLYPDRIIVGVDGESGRSLMELIYLKFAEEKYPVLFTSRNSAEMIKYASNSFLATKIAYINEIANLCEKTGADVEQVSEGMGMDPRIGKEFLKAGPGFGGSCFPKDILALKHLANEKDSESLILNATIDSNQKRYRDMVAKMKRELGNLSGLMISVFGLTFKAGTDDIRSSPAIEIIKILLKEGCYICAYDPKGMKNAKDILQIDLAKDYLKCAMGANAILILTEWDEFKNLDYNKLGQDIGQKIIFDYRNILDPEEAKKHGFKIYQIGRV